MLGNELVVLALLKMISFSYYYYYLNVQITCSQKSLSIFMLIYDYGKILLVASAAK
jgi:hypothetical protein